jgi:dihydrofolate reductase
MMGRDFPFMIRDRTSRRRLRFDGFRHPRVGGDPSKYQVSAEQQAWTDPGLRRDDVRGMTFRGLFIRLRQTRFAYPARRCYRSAMNDLPISLIVAVAENGVIGCDGVLPWRLSSDLKTFRRLTMDKPIIMGRRTFQSIGKALDGRDNIVVTRDPEFAAEGISTCETVTDALTLARVLATTRGADEIMVIGGVGVFDAALPVADRIYLTRVHADVEGDRHFPALDDAIWQEVAREALPQGPRDEFASTLFIYERHADSTAESM